MSDESMFQRVKARFPYWGFLLAKLMAGAAISSSVLAFINLFWKPVTPWFHINRDQFCWDLGYSTLVMVWFLFSYGLFYLAFWDQKYRCRTCLRPLVMPVESGSWSTMLQLGRPSVEYICAFGHGRLSVEELQFPGKVEPAWTQQGDIWTELFALSDAAKSGSDHNPDGRH